MVKDLHEIELEDENRLADLGYKQELQRDWSVMHNFGVSFSIIVSHFFSLSFLPIACRYILRYRFCERCFET
jgi:hypothetical protein